MPTNEELMAQIEELKTSLATTNRKLKEVEDFAQTHIGLDWGTSGVHAPHPNQSIDTGEYGGGIMRLDRYGIQVLSQGGSRSAFFFFDDQFQPNPNTPTNPSGTPLSALIGIADRELAQPYSQISNYSTAGTATAEHSTLAEDDTNDKAVIQSYVNVGSDIATVRHEMDGGRTFAQLLLSNTVFRLASFTSDPGTLGDGDIWYRSDTDTVHARVNGVTVDLGGGGSSMPMPPIVSTMNWHCVGEQLSANSVAAAASAVWPTANTAIYIPLLVTEDITVTKLWWHNGATASGNVNMALYTGAGAQVSGTETGSTAQGTINVIQEVNIADTALTAGLYYIAIVMDNTTGTMFRHSVGAAINRAMGLATEAGVFDLPANATLATANSAYVPICGIATRTAVA
jgi:hypothetical protein